MYISVLFNSKYKEHLMCSRFAFDATLIFDPSDSCETCRLLVSDTQVCGVLSIIHHSIKVLGPLLMFEEIMAKTKKMKG